MTTTNTPLRPGFTQVCVIEGLLLGDTPPAEFEVQLGAVLGVRAQYLETVLTRPDRDARGQPVPDTGGRSDVLFAVHHEDLGSAFNVERMARGVRWLEDVLSSRNNPRGLIHPERLLDYLPREVRALVREG